MKSLNMRMRELERICYEVPQDICDVLGCGSGQIRKVPSSDVWQVEFDIHSPRCRRMTIHGRLVNRIQFGETQIQFKTAHHAWAVIRTQVKTLLENY